MTLTADTILEAYRRVKAEIGPQPTDLFAGVRIIADSSAVAPVPDTFLLVRLFRRLGRTLTGRPVAMRFGDTIVIHPTLYHLVKEATVQQ
jgi:hypothetical protein